MKLIYQTEAKDGIDCELSINLVRPKRNISIHTFGVWIFTQNVFPPLCANNGIHKKVYERLPAAKLLKIFLLKPGLGPFVNRITVQPHHVTEEILYT